MIFAAPPLGAVFAALAVVAALVFGGWQKYQNAQLETTIAEQASAVQIAASQQRTAESARSACEAALDAAHRHSDNLIASIRESAASAARRAADAQAAAARRRAADDDHAASAPATESRIRNIYHRLTVRVTTAPPPDEECARAAAILESVLQ